MRQLARVTVTMRELDRLKCIQAVVDGDLKPMSGRRAARLDDPTDPKARTDTVGKARWGSFQRA